MSHCPSRGNIKERMYEMRRCGCNSCYREYHNLECELREGDRYRQDRPRINDYSQDKTDALYYMIDTVKQIAAAGKDIKMDTPKIEEPKNFAVKNLVDSLKSQQTMLSQADTNIAYHKNALKPYVESKAKATKNIKELGLALKKLGHKE